MFGVRVVFQAKGPFVHEELRAQVLEGLRGVPDRGVPAVLLVAFVVIELPADRVGQPDKLLGFGRLRSLFLSLSLSRLRSQVSRDRSLPFCAHFLVGDKTLFLLPVTSVGAQNLIYEVCQKSEPGGFPPQFRFPKIHVSEEQSHSLKL